MLLPFALRAQSCPIAAGCTPGNAPATTAGLGMGIARVVLGALDTTVQNAPPGYQDYACRARPVRLARGGTYTLSIYTNPLADENARAWLDFNGNGLFEPAELVLSSNNARQHTAQFTVPATAAVGAALRLRVASDYFAAPFPTACYTPQYGEAQDYRVLVGASLPRPVAQFSTPDTVACGGAVAFTDRSLNSPDNWRWDFGDGTTSTQQHPRHQYAAPGRYTVRLRACNAAGCDSLSLARYVRVPAGAPAPASCRPGTLAYCCSYGITRVRLGTLNWPSADGRAGYEDFSCAGQTTLTADWPVNLQLTTGPNPHDVAVYLDRNDDGTFSADELLQVARNQVDARLTLVIPAAGTTPLLYNRPLRLRIIADQTSTAAPSACQAVRTGQVEDYAVVLVPNTQPPIARFEVGYQAVCRPVNATFTNTSISASSYEWDFGDGTTATGATPPAHVYAQAGAYPVRLVAHNAFGSDTAWQYVAVNAGCPGYCPALGRGGDPDVPLYFDRVQLGSIDNSTMRTYRQGYFDFTAWSTQLEPQGRYVLRLNSSRFSWPNTWEPDTEVGAWIDFNQNGTFDGNELIGRLLANQRFVVPFQVPATARPGATRMRLLIMRHGGNNPFFTPCPPAYHESSVEDYRIVIVPPVRPTRAGFRTPLPAACNALVQFTDTSTALPTSWRWDFGDGTTSTQQHPQHRYGAPGTYQVSLSVSNLFGRSQVTRPVVVTALNQGAVAASCTPLGGGMRKGSYMAQGIRFELGGLTHQSFGNGIGYQDLTCATPPAQIARSGSVYRLNAFQTYSTSGMLMRMWLDVNNDGRLDSATELVVDTRTNVNGQLYNAVKTGMLYLPATAPLNTPLRLRVNLHFWSWPVYMPWDNPHPCVRDTAWAVVRDFSVVLTQVTAAPAPTVVQPWSAAPNPSTGLLTLRDLPLDSELEVLDALGRRAYRSRLQVRAGQALVDLRHLPRGFYILRLSGQRHTQKVLLE